MPTILELFRGSTFDTDVDSKSQEGKGTLFSQIKSFGEQELTGIRVKSLVEANNPLIYGNEATRIALRSTPSLDKMRTDEGDGGLIGGTIKNLRTVVNSTLGVPQTLIPSSYTKAVGGGEGPDLKGLAKLAKSAADKANEKFGRGATLNDPNLGVQSGYLGPEGRIALIKSGGKGSFVGGLLSGGNPKTIGKQAAGKLIKEGKKKLREALFKNNPFKSKGETGSNTPVGINKTNDTDETITQEYPEIIENTEGAKYSEQLKKQGTFIKYLSVEEQLGKLRVGPSYPNSKELLGGDKLQEEAKSNDGVKPKRIGREPPLFNKDKKYTSKFKPTELIYAQDGKGFAKDSDIINASGIYNGGTDTETNVKYKLDEKDFIPLYFRSIVTGETVHFRGTITGLSETISPSWSSGKFSGNPFSYHTYDGIERTVAFNFTIYPMNSAELANNWTKIEFLTSLTYPLGNLNQPYNKKAYQSGEIGSVRAPIIYFTMGDLYKDKICFIDSLQYTIPDNSNWQLDGKTLSETERPVNESGSTNPNPTPNYFSTVGSDKLDVNKGYKLPHLVEVATTLKFIEQRNNTEERTKLYSFKSLTYSDSGNGGTPPITAR